MMYASTTRSRLRRLAAAGVAATAIFGFAACGDNSSSSSSGADTSSSSDAGGSSGSGDSGSSAAASDLSEGDTLSAGDMTSILKDATNNLTTAHMTMNMKGSSGGQKLNMKADGDIQMKPLAEHMTMDMMGQKVEVIMVGKNMYMNGGNGKWLKMSLADVAKQSGMGSSADALTNPLSSIEKMSGAIKSATYKGSESVDGSDAKHYVVTIDTKKYLKQFGTSSSASGVPSTMQQDLWINGDGQMVRAEVGMGSSGTVDVHVTDQGKPVTVKAPPASQVTQMPSK